MRTEHLQYWLHTEMRETLPGPTHWEEMVGLNQDAFYEGHLTEGCT